MTHIELLDMFDKDNQALDIQLQRDTPRDNALWHRVIHIWLINQDGMFLSQKRSHLKTKNPNLWDVSVAGHVSAWEEPIISALREIEEEIWLSLQKSHLSHIGTFANTWNQNSHRYIYFAKIHATKEDFILQKEEVQDVRFLSIQDLEKDIKQHPFLYVTRWQYWNTMIQEIKKRL